MARKREVFTASVATETTTKIQEIVAGIQERIALPVAIHPGIVVDVLVSEATTEKILQIILGKSLETESDGTPDNSEH